MQVGSHRKEVFNLHVEIPGIGSTRQFVTHYDQLDKLMVVVHQRVYLVQRIFFIRVELAVLGYFQVLKNVPQHFPVKLVVDHDDLPIRIA